MKAVTAVQMSKLFTGGKKAVDSVSFALEQGEIFGFLGPNGAGKTTTVKLLNGILSPTQGSCSVFDLNPAAQPEQVHRIAGVVTEHAQMYDNLTGLENLQFYGSVFGVEAKTCKEQASRLLKLLELEEAKGRKLATYSTGMRQRLSLARALIHRPKILFLDEPTSGLDPESAQNVNNLIQDLAKNEGITIFLCTHQLRYAQEICSSYGLIENGSLLAEGTLDELRQMVFSGMTLYITADRFPKDRAYGHLEGQTAAIQVQSEEEIPGIVQSIVENGGRVYHVSAAQLTLEEIYFSLLESYKKEGVNHA